MRESAIQTKIRLTLKKGGWLVVKCIQMSINGWPDQQAFKNGVIKFIECKVPGKEPSPLQLYIHDLLRKQGFEVIVATSVEDVQHLL